MVKFKLLVSSLLLFFLWMINSSQTTRIETNVSTCSIDNVVFKNNEELIYKIYYNWGLIWLSAGEATFQVKEMKDGYFMKAVGKTYSTYEWLYAVHDIYEVYVDKETLLPIWSTRDIKENNYTQYERMVFNQKAGTVTSTRGKTKKEATSAVIPIKDCAHDILSILYFVRNYPFKTFKNGQSFPVSVFLDRENNELSAKYNGTSKRKDFKGLGVFNSYIISPATIAGKVFDQGNTMRMYISEDSNQIPLMVETKLSVGSVKVVLKSYKNLRHPLHSKVK